MITNDQRRIWVDLRDTGTIRYNPSGTPLISGVNKNQYGGFYWGVIKPQATELEVNSRCVNNISSINTYIPPHALD